MAADILLYRAHKVPVGEDSSSTWSFVGKCCARFHFLYGAEVFPEPEAVLTKVSKVPGLDGRKMSKSYDNGIFLRDTPDVILEMHPADGFGYGAGAQVRCWKPGCVQCLHLPQALLGCRDVRSGEYRVRKAASAASTARRRWPKPSRRASSLCDRGSRIACPTATICWMCCGRAPSVPGPPPRRRWRRCGKP